MLPQVALLKYLLKYQNYKDYKQYVEIPKEMKELKQLYYCLDVLQEKFPDSDKTLEELEVMLHASYPNLKQVELNGFNDIINQLHKVSVQDGVLELLLRESKKRKQAYELAVQALAVAEGRSQADTIFSLAEQFKADEVREDTSKEEQCIVTDDLYALEAATVTAPGVRWRLACLNRSLGPLRDGDFGFVFARPETGKTTFLADQCTYFAEQTTRPIIWFNNEEQGTKVKTRIYQASLGKTSDDVWADKDKNMTAYKNSTKGNLILYDDVTIYRNNVEKMVKKYNPQVIVMDQIDKIKGFDADRPDLVFGKIYQWARGLAKQGCAVIGICQADGTGDGVRWLTMGHVAEAKTSKQAEADWILGIGRSNETGTDDIRYFNISKNKLMGDKDTDPNERHGRYFVLLRATVARYEDLADEQ